MYTVEKYIRLCGYSMTPERPYYTYCMSVSLLFTDLPLPADL